MSIGNWRGNTAPRGSGGGLAWRACKPGVNHDRRALAGRGSAGNRFISHRHSGESRAGAESAVVAVDGQATFGIASAATARGGGGGWGEVRGRLQSRVDALIAGSTVSMSCVPVTGTDDVGSDWRQADQRSHAAGDSCDSAYRLHIHVTHCTFTGCHGATLSVTRDGVTQSATRNVARCVTRAGVTALSRGGGAGERGGRGVTPSTGLLQPRAVIIGGWGEITERADRAANGD